MLLEIGFNNLDEIDREWQACVRYKRADGPGEVSGGAVKWSDDESWQTPAQTRRDIVSIRYEVGQPVDTCESRSPRFLTYPEEAIVAGRQSRGRVIVQMQPGKAPHQVIIQQLRTLDVDEVTNGSRGYEYRVVSSDLSKSPFPSPGCGVLLPELWEVPAKSRVRPTKIRGWQGD